MKSEIGTMPAPVVIPKSMEQVEREHQGLCDLIRRDVRRIVAEELDKRGLVDRGDEPGLDRGVHPAEPGTAWSGEGRRPR